MFLSFQPWTLGAVRLEAASTLLLFAIGLPAFGQQTASTNQANYEAVLDSLHRGRSISRVAISPDGKRLAWAEAGKIHVAPYDHLDKAQLVSAAPGFDDRCSEDEFTWSPDSQSLAFFSNCGNVGSQSNLYITRLNAAGLDANGARRATELHGYAHEPEFSPDGESIAFLYVENATRPAGALAAMDAPTGVIGEDNIEVQRVAVTRLDMAAPNAIQSTPANLHVYEFDWSPDSKSLAYIAADPPGENNWWVAKLYTQGLPGPVKAILAPAEIPGPLHGLQIAVPRWSPDGRSIAFIGGLMSDQGSTGGDVWIVPSAGGEPRDLTPQRTSTPSWIEWDGDRHLYIDEIAGGDARLIHLEVPDNPISPDLPAPVVGTAFLFPGSAGDGRFELSLSATADRSLFVFSGGTFDRPAEIYAARPGESQASKADTEIAGVKQLTHLNDKVNPAWGKSVSIVWSSDSFQVQGWLTLPKDYNPAKKYPLIVEVHGGPAAAVLPRWGGSWELSPSFFSALGYFVLQPNPRGSYGQGEAFTEANRKDFGYGDLRDILAGVDAALAQYPVDPNRVGITGWSYGGFMTMFATTQTNRFKAAVAGAGISDWLSYYGENSIDQWMIPYFGASVYDDPAVYAKSSPINFIKQDHTPALIVVGDRDGECPAPQSFEYWHALRDLGVPAQLVVYPNEGHGFTDSDHTRDVLERAAEWFARYMP